jgi:phosphoglycolate phosphatase
MICSKRIVTTMKAIIFDLDGTLLNTLEDLCDAVNRVLARNGFPPHPLDAYRYFVGDGAAALFKRALPAARQDEATLHRCLVDFRDDYGRHWNVKTRPYPGIPEMLDALVARGARLAVLSNKPHETTEKCVGGFLVRWRFDVVLGQHEPLPKKPDPAGALAIAARLEVRPDEILYLGDTGTDMKTAVSAGMYPAGVLWGFRTAGELVDNGARSLVSHPMEVVELIQRLHG